MEVFKFNIIPTEEFIKRENFRNLINKCSHCGECLQFSYKNAPEKIVLEESSQCPLCAKEIAPTYHRIH